MTEENCKYIYGFKWFAIQCCEQFADAEDLLQDIIFRLLVKPEIFEALNEAEKRNYIMRSIQNGAISIGRRKNAGKRNPLLFSSFPTKHNAEAYAILELKEIRKKALEYKLSESLFLSVAGFTCVEIGKMTGKNKNTILG